MEQKRSRQYEMHRFRCDICAKQVLHKEHDWVSVGRLSWETCKECRSALTAFIRHRNDDAEAAWRRDLHEQA